MSRILIVFGDRTADEVIAAFRRTSDAKSFDRVEKWFYEQDGSASVIEGIAREYQEVFFHVGVVDEYLRISIVDLAMQLNWQPWTIIDPAAVVDPSAEIGAGTFVAAQAVISSRAKVGPHCLVHFHALVGHDVVLGAHCVILPGAKISGSAVLGARCLVGSNAFLSPRVRLADRVKVDALTYVEHHLPVNGAILSVRKPPTAI